MLKSKMLLNVLLVLTISLCLHPIDSSIAGDCAEKKTGGEVQTVSGDHNYTDNWFPKIQFDPSIPDEMAPNSSISLNVIGGCSPYTWSVSGNGFSLQESQTTGLSNTLIVDGTACGAATITVTGCSGGTPITGYVRCTAGRWVLHTSCSNFSSCGGTCGYAGCDGTIGANLRYRDYYCQGPNSAWCMDPPCKLLPQTCQEYGSYCYWGTWCMCSLQKSVLCEWACFFDPRANCPF